MNHLPSAGPELALDVEVAGAVGVAAREAEGGLGQQLRVGDRGPLALQRPWTAGEGKLKERRYSPRRH